MSQRCDWPADDELMVRYHDEEWGVPVHDDQALFRKLMLDAFQAGLSWRTILHKRGNFLEAFDDFDPKAVSKYGEPKIQELLNNAGIVRNQAKIRATVHNAQLLLKQFPEQGSFSEYIWSFVDGKTIHNRISSDGDYVSTSPESDALSKDLKKRGWKFMGSTVVYAFMQAVGLVNDHQQKCFRFHELETG